MKPIWISGIHWTSSGYFRRMGTENPIEGIGRWSSREIQKFLPVFLTSRYLYLGMDQYLLIPFLGGWTSILPAVLMFTRGTRFWHTAISVFLSGCSDKNRGLTWSEPLTVTRAYAVDLGRLDELHSYKRWVNQNVDPSYTSYKISCNHG